MSGRSKFSPYRIPTQGVTGSGSGWTLLAFLFSTGNCSLLLLPLGSSSTLALLALAEFLVTSMGLWMWECLNPALSVHPSLHLSVLFFFFLFWLGWYFWASLQEIYLISQKNLFQLLMTQRSCSETTFISSLFWLILLKQ